MRRRWAASTLLLGLVVGLTVPAAAAVDGVPRFLTKWGNFGSLDGEFGFPRGVAVGPDGTVYVVDTDNNRVQAFAPDGTFSHTWGSFGSLDGELSFPQGIAVAPDGTVYVTDGDNNRVQAFEPDGTFITKWGSFGSGDGEFSFPFGVAVARDGTVYVTDGGNHRVQAFARDGTTVTFITKWGSFGTDDGEFDTPRGVAVAADGTVYVADLFNHRVQAFARDGTTVTFITKWGTEGSADGQFSFARGIAVAPDGTVYVADSGNDRIQAFDLAGNFLTKWGSDGADDGQFNQPFGVAAGLFAVVYLADTDNSRIQKFAFPQVIRAAGSNRYATAAETSMLHHPFFDVDTVFAATGLNFPDALAGAVAASATRSPLLLTASVPQVTAAELDRLTPDDIVILGGEAVVDSATATALSAWGTITRLAGANRYLTAVAISQHLYPVDGSADTVVIATGTNFADALAGAPLAALRNGPVLLTQPTTLPAAVADEITRLDPAAIIVLGGPAAVSSAVFEQLSALAPTTRISGDNRYLTAVAISEEAFPDGAGIVYVAVGTNFPDALAGAAQAAASGSPVLLSTTDTLPFDVVVEITRLDPHAIIILGGTAVISPAVESQLRTLVGL